MLVRLLTGRLDLLTAFAAKDLPEVSEDGELATLELMPREPRDDVDLVVLDVARASGALRRVSVIDPIGSAWTYEFGPVRPAEAPPADAFVVEIPEGFTVSHE
jgi:outer membrane lipoprotein-sorting protein